MRRSYNRLDGEAADHGQVRVRREEGPRLRGALDVRDLRPLVEHAADSGGGVRRPRAAGETPSARGRRDCCGRGGDLDPVDRVRERDVHRRRAAADARLALRLRAVLAAPLPADRARGAALAAASGVAMRTLRRRSSQEDVAFVPSAGRPVLLATLDVPYAEEA